MLREPANDRLAGDIERNARAGDLAIVRERQIEADRKRRIETKAYDPDELSCERPVRELANAEEADDRGAEDVERGEAQGFERSPDQSKRAAAGKEIAVDRHLGGEEQDQKADLEPSERSVGKDRRSLQPVLYLICVAPLFHRLKIAPSAVEKVLALARLNPELGGRLDGRTFDYRQGAFEIECREAFSVELHLIVQSAMGGPLLALDVFEDPLLSLIESAAVLLGSRFFAIGASCGLEIELARDFLNIELRKCLGGGPIDMRNLLNPLDQPLECFLDSHNVPINCAWFLFLSILHRIPRQ